MRIAYRNRRQEQASRVAHTTRPAWPRLAAEFAALAGLVAWALACLVLMAPG